MARKLVGLLALAALLSANASSAPAKTYRWVDREGNVTYADRPPQSDEVAPPPSQRPGGTQPRRPVLPIADELLEVSGFKRQVPGIAERARANLVQGMEPLGANDKSAVDRVSEQAFRPDALYGLIVEEFSQYVDDTKVKDVLGWYRTPSPGGSPSSKWRSRRR